MTPKTVTIREVLAARKIVHEQISPAPLVRSYALERELGLPTGRRVWLKDYGWTPVGSFKLMGALNWMAHHSDEIGNRPVIAHSSGNFASGIAFAGNRFGKRVIVIMPDTAPQVKFNLTRSFGAEIRTYNIARDHQTGERDKMASEIAESEGAVQASPYDDNDVIAGNGVGGLEVIDEIKRQDRTLTTFVCPVSGGGLMAGHSIAIANGFPGSAIIGVEPTGADDFRQSRQANRRVRVEHPKSICDGLLSYDVGVHNWPVLKEHVTDSTVVPDEQTRLAMRWLYENHGLKTEPSGAIAVAAVLTGVAVVEGSGDLVIVISGRNADEGSFQDWIDISNEIPKRS